MRNMQHSLLLLGKNCQAAQAVSCLTSRGPGKDSPSPRDSHTGAWVPQWFTWMVINRYREDGGETINDDGSLTLLFTMMKKCINKEE